MAQRGPADKVTGYRAVAGGIATNAYMKDMGKYTMRFDPRSTEQANDTRSEVNGKAQGKAHRTALWETRQRAKRRGASEKVV